MAAEGKKSEAGSTEPPAVDLNTIAGRLRWAIGQRPARGRQRGVRLFQRDMKARAADRKVEDKRLSGVTLPSIMTYLNDETEPTLEFLREAASVLAVREAWLAFGEGFPTAEENAAVAGFRKESLGPLRGIGAMLVGVSIRDELGKGSFGFWELPGTARESVIRGFDTYRWLPSTLKEFSDAIPATEALTARYVSYLAAPFTLLGIDPDALEPVERALLVDALLRPLDIARWASRRDAGRTRAVERAAEQEELEKDPLYRLLMEPREHEDEAEDDDVAD